MVSQILLASQPTPLRVAVSLSDSICLQLGASRASIFYVTESRVTLMGPGRDGGRGLHEILFSLPHAFLCCFIFLCPIGRPSLTTCCPQGILMDYHSPATQLDGFFSQIRRWASQIRNSRHALQLPTLLHCGGRQYEIKAPCKAARVLLGDAEIHTLQQQIE